MQNCFISLFKASFNNLWKLELPNNWFAMEIHQIILGSFYKNFDHEVSTGWNINNCRTVVLFDVSKQIMLSSGKKTKKQKEKKTEF